MLAAHTHVNNGLCRDRIYAADAGAFMQCPKRDRPGQTKGWIGPWAIFGSPCPGALWAQSCSADLEEGNCVFFLLNLAHLPALAREPESPNAFAGSRRDQPIQRRHLPKNGQ